MMIDPLESRTHFSATLVAGQSYGTRITEVGQRKNYVIRLTAGQTILVAAGDRGSDPAFQPTIRLIGPDRRTIRTSSSDSGAFIGSVAKKTGDYIVRVADKARATGSLNLTAFYTGRSTVRDSDDASNASVAESGRRYAATIAPGDLDVWRIDAQSDDYLEVVANENTAGDKLGLGVLVVGPDGRTAAAVENDAGLHLDLPETRTGTYYAVVYEPGSDATGRYGISFGLTPATQTAEDPDTQQTLVSRTPRNGTLPSGDIDLFEVSVPEGKKITVTATRTGSNLTPVIQLLNPLGTQVATASGTTTATLSYTTAAPNDTGFPSGPGIYGILIRNRDPNTGGTYRLTYTLA